jgi:hypothetical protein
MFMRSEINTMDDSSTAIHAGSRFESLARAS